MLPFKLLFVWYPRIVTRLIFNYASSKCASYKTQTYHLYAYLPIMLGCGVYPYTRLDSIATQNLFCSVFLLIAPLAFPLLFFRMLSYWIRVSLILSRIATCYSYLVYLYITSFILDSNQPIRLKLDGSTSQKWKNTSKMRLTGVLQTFSASWLLKAVATGW